MKAFVSLLVSVAVVLIAPSAFAQVTKPVPGKYYKLQFKTAHDQYLRIGNNGVAGGSTDLADDGRSDWLFIPTGSPNEYWIFSKGAQGGRGQALNLGDYASWFGQWDFDGGNRQRFRLDAVGEYVRLVSKYKRLSDGEEAVSTRWNAEAFAYRVNPNDDAQLFRLIQSSEPATSEDPLVSYLFWNTDNAAIQDYFYETLNWLPQPQELRINEIVFLNDSTKTVTPVIHHFGCGFTPSRDGKLACWGKDLSPGGRASMTVDNYLRDAEAIWGIMGAGVLTAIAVVVTAGAGVAVVAAVAASSFAVSAAAAGLVVLDAAIIVVDVYDISATAADLQAHDEVDFSDNEWTLREFGVDADSAAAIVKELGRFSFAVRGKSYRDLLDGWYIHEAVSDKGLYKMFFGGGKAVFLFADYDVTGTWKADGKEEYLGIRRSPPANAIAVRPSAVPDIPDSGEVRSYPADPKLINVYTDSRYRYAFESSQNLTVQPVDGSWKETYQRLHPFEGEWKLEGENVYLTVTGTNSGLTVTRRNAPGGPVVGAAVKYNRGSLANVYTSSTGDLCTVLGANRLEFLAKGSQNPRSYSRLAED